MKLKDIKAIMKYYSDRSQNLADLKATLNNLHINNTNIKNEDTNDADIKDSDTDNDTDIIIENADTIIVD